MVKNDSEFTKMVGKLQKGTVLTRYKKELVIRSTVMSADFL